MVNYRLYLTSDKNEENLEGPYFLQEESLPVVGAEIHLTADKEERAGLVSRVIHRHIFDKITPGTFKFKEYTVWAKKI